MKKSINNIYYSSGIFWIPLISGILFLYESLYTRIISVVLSNNYVFLVISLSVVGYGVGSSLYYNIDRKKPEPGDKSKFLLIELIILFSSIFVILAIVYFIPFISYWIYLIPVSIPFIIAGYIFSNYYNNINSKPQTIFTLDLIGAVVGLIGGFILMNKLGIIQTTIFIGMIAVAVLFLFIIKYKKILIILPSVLFFLLLFTVINPNSVNWINKNFTGLNTSPYTSLARISNAGEKGEIIATKWDAFSRTDVIDLGEDSTLRIVTIDGAANASMIRRVEGSNEHLNIKYQIDFLPYLIRKIKTAAIIGAGGGRDVLQALHGDVSYIDAIEINKSSIDLTNNLKEYNGSIFYDDRVNIQKTDGRSFIQKSDLDYDLILLSLVMTETSQSGSLVTAETYIYTKEAVSTYIDKLTPTGVLTFVSHNTQDMIKIIRTIRDVLLKKGVSIEDMKKQIMVVGNVMVHGEETMLRNPLILYSPKEFTDSEIITAKRFINYISAIPILMKNTPEVEIIQNILEDDNLKLPFNFKPATDERPYFYQFSEGLPRSLTLTIVISLLATLLLWTRKVISNKIIKKASYFSLSGMAFMMIEIILLQKMTLILGHSTLAFIFTVSVVLGGAGSGSLMSSKIPFLEKKAALIAGAMLLLGTLLLYLFKYELLSLHISVRLLFIGSFFFMTSFFQGIIFPSAIKQVKELIPIYYGINSSFSLVGSIFALILIFLLGSTGAMLIGSSIYIVLFIIKPYTLGKEQGVSNGKN